MGDAAKAFVCGHPIKHSRSPLIHGSWLRDYGIEGTYAAIDVGPAEASAFFRDLPSSGFRGGNVTIPHKEVAFAALDKRSEAAELIGAVNTLWLEEGALCGDNTDAYGFAANLDERAPAWRRSPNAIVLGAGGASRAVIHAIRQAGIGDIRVVNRSTARAEELAHRFGAGVTAHPLDALDSLLGDARFVVNTTSLGMDGQKDLPADPDLLPDDAIVTDIVYVPLVTPLLAAARSRGLTAVDGLGMLLHQAVPGFERWFGRRPEVTPALRRAIEADLGVSA